MLTEPRLDWQFLAVCFCAAVFNILTVYCYVKANKYKHQVDEYRLYFNLNAETSPYNVANSTPEMTKTSNQSIGNDILSNIKGKRTPVSMAPKNIPVPMQLIIPTSGFIRRVYHRWSTKSKENHILR
jgi:hypothetical protein